jgi:hypothetical protein
MLESEFKQLLMARLRKEFPGCIILKNDPAFLLGFPDWIILFGSRWAALEVKRNRLSHHQPNQSYWVELSNDMGAYASFIYPENMEKIVNELQQALRPS